MSRYRGLKIQGCRVEGVIRPRTAYIPVKLKDGKCTVIKVKIGKRMSSRVKLPNGITLRFEKIQGTRKRK